MDALVARVRDDVQAVELRRRNAEMNMPARMPVSALLVDADGHVRRETFRADREQPTDRNILERMGLLGRVRTPRGLTLDQIGRAFVIGGSRDASDVEHVLRFDLVRSADRAA